MDRLPPEVICRIADRLPLKCLVRLRCARKEWYTDPFLKPHMTKFIKPHMTRFIERPILVSLNPSGTSDGKPRFEVYIDICFVKAWVPQLAHPVRPRLVGTCNGLMCWCLYESFRACLPSHLLVLVNPLLEEVLSVSTSQPHVANPLERWWTASGSALDHASGAYKLVLYRPGAEIWLFDLDTRSWREITVPEECLCPLGVGIFLGGTLYWERLGGCIVSFDAAEEHFSLLSCPAPFDALFHLGDHLGVAGFNRPRPGSRKRIVIWEFNIHNKGWTKKYEIGSPRLLDRLWVRGDDIDIVGAQNGIILFRFAGTLYPYDPRSRKFECIRGIPTNLYCLRGSVESVSRFNV